MPSREATLAKLRKLGWTVNPGENERRRWAREEGEELTRDLEEAGRHVDNCMCAAVQDGYVQGTPICFQRR